MQRKRTRSGLVSRLMVWRAPEGSTIPGWRAQCALALFLLVSAPPLFIASISLAQVQPEDLITAERADKVKDLVSPGVYQRVKNGLTMKIAPTQAIDWPPPYKAATEANAANVHIAPDHRSLTGYVAGLPFPNVDANDPDAAIKIIWNSQFRPELTDDYDLRFVDCDFGYTKTGGRQGDSLPSIQLSRRQNCAGRACSVIVSPIPIRQTTSGRSLPAIAMCANSAKK